MYKTIIGMETELTTLMLIVLLSRIITKGKIYIQFLRLGTLVLQLNLNI